MLVLLKIVENTMDTDRNENTWEVLWPSKRCLVKSKKKDLIGYTIRHYVLGTTYLTMKGTTGKKNHRIRFRYNALIK